MNSIIEAQEEFTNCFGELTLEHLYEGVALPKWSNEYEYLERFIAAHQKPAPIVIPIGTIEDDKVKYYKAID